MLKLFYFVLITITFYSCTRKTETNENCITTIDIDINTVSKNNSAVNLIKEFKLIPLGRNSSAIINQIGKLKITRDHIVISDHKSQKVLFFSYENGAYLGEINSQGRGPGEFLRINDYYVDADLKYIEILDGIQNKILRFDFDGNFINSKKLPFRFSSFEKLNDFIIFSKSIYPTSKEWMYQLIITDEELNIINKEIIVEEDKSAGMVIAPNNPLQINSREIIFQPIYSSTIYSLNSNLELKPKYCLNFLDAWLEEETIYNLDGLQSMQFKERISSSGKVYFVNFLEGDKFALINFRVQKDLFLCVYNKEIGTTTLIKNENFDICFGSEFIEYFDGYFISIKQPFELKEYFNEMPDYLNEETKLIVKNIDDYDNPILLLVKFK